MIVKMLKAYVAVRADEKTRLLDALREMGVVHLQPVAPEQAKVDEKTAMAISQLARAGQILSSIEPAGDAPGIDSLTAADRVLTLFGQSGDLRTRIATLAREAGRLEVWGDVRLEQLRALRDSGIDLRFHALPAEDVSQIQADCVEVIRPGKQTIVGIAARGAEPRIPESAEPLELPEHDRPSLLAEAKELDDTMQSGKQELARLANLTGALSEKHAEFELHARYVMADRGGLGEGDLYAVQGWIPADQGEAIQPGLAERGVPAAVELIAPTEDEAPPTLIRYARWARPIKVLFDILGTTPGYREMDLSCFFMVALPIFAAMLIGDAGYGLVFTIAALAGWRSITAKAGRPAAQLLLIFALVTTAWGLLTGNIFGVSPASMTDAGGFWAALGQPFAAIALLWDKDPEVARNLIIKVSFIFGSLHLVLAHLRQALALAPNSRWLSEIGWAAFLAAMLGVVWLLFFPTQMWMPIWVMKFLLIGGFALVLLFSHPHRNPAVRITMGLIVNLLPTISTFSDTMSYIRLMAVGLASYYIASAFNGLAGTVAGGGAIMYLPAALILILAHSLNIVLGIIAIFAHGVRLNMLEFSSNAGVQWEGFPYSPFGQTATY